jgi:ATP-dependent helicase/nuclease subunit A
MTEPAKSSVSALRRRARELVDDEAVRRFEVPPGLKRRAGVQRLESVSAAERGTLYHRFLQHVALNQSHRVDFLQAQLQALVERRLFTADEATALDLEVIAAFWQSDTGCAIRAEARWVRRELPFTARFSDAEVRTLLGQPPEPALADEFVVVQGIVDLAVLLPKELWLLDFKTDTVDGGDLKERLTQYEPQLNLYAAALERIYHKPIGHRWLHFLAAQRTVEVHQEGDPAPSLEP